MVSQPIHTLFKVLVDMHNAQGTSPSSDLGTLRGLINDRTHVRGSDTVLSFVNKFDDLKKVFRGDEYKALFDNIKKVTGAEQPVVPVPYHEVVRHLINQIRLDVDKLNFHGPVGIKEMNAVIRAYLAVNKAVAP